MLKLISTHKAVVISICIFIIIMIIAVSGLIKMSNKDRIIGKDTNAEDINTFLYTIASTTNPPEYLSYRFYNTNGKYSFHYETRVWDKNPATDFKTIEKDIELTAEQWEKLTDCLMYGTLTKQKEHTETGSKGPWMYLYSNDDKKKKIVEFSFASYEKKSAFEAFCEELISE